MYGVWGVLLLAVEQLAVGPLAIKTLAEKHDKQA